MGYFDFNHKILTIYSDDLCKNIYSDDDTDIQLMKIMLLMIITRITNFQNLPSLDNIQHIIIKMYQSFGLTSKPYTWDYDAFMFRGLANWLE